MCRSNSVSLVVFKSKEKQLMNRFSNFLSILCEPLLRIAGYSADLIKPGAGVEVEKRSRGALVSLGQTNIRIHIDRGVLMNGISRIELGNNVRLLHGCQLVAGLHGSIVIGEGSHIGRNSIVSGHGNVVIGKNCNISGLVALYSVSNQPDGTIKKAQIEIGDNVNIGANATILPGIVIGNSATIGAGAVVTKNVDPNSIVVGVPAKKMSSSP